MAILRQGGNAVDAMIAAAAAVSVFYPHMNSLAGDGFWLIHQPGEKPRAVDACGFAAQQATVAYYREQGFTAIPSRGAPSAVTMAGTLSGWEVARAIAADYAEQMPLPALLAAAQGFASDGISVTESLAAASRKVSAEFSGRDCAADNFKEYRRIFTRNGQPLVAGERLYNPDLAATLLRLANHGLDDFYRGALAKKLSGYLQQTGSPLSEVDFSDYRAVEVAPLSVTTKKGQLFNLPAPTQGIASLLILAIYDQLQDAAFSDEEHVHVLIEATKQAFMVRDREVCDPRKLSNAWPGLLDAEHIRALAAQVRNQALPWPQVAEPGDTVWMGCVDARGMMVSFIQSIYWEFGSGVVIPGTGLVWNNRGVSFALDASHCNALQPRYKPFHTLNPALALLHDGRRLGYGTMGGEGQPQTQAALFSNYVYRHQTLPQAIASGRWLLGRTWGDAQNDLKMEQDLFEQLGNKLQQRGHTIKPVLAQNELMGHAGAVVSWPEGAAIAATDPRSDGGASAEPYTSLEKP